MKNMMGIKRKEKGLTQEALAELLGISQSTVAAYETGIRRPSPEVVNKLLGIFGITISEAWEMFYSEGQNHEDPDAE